VQQTLVRKDSSVRLYSRYLEQTGGRCRAPQPRAAFGIELRMGLILSSGCSRRRAIMQDTNVKDISPRPFGASQRCRQSTVLSTASHSDMPICLASVVAGSTRRKGASPARSASQIGIVALWQPGTLRSRNLDLLENVRGTESPLDPVSGDDFVRTTLCEGLP
jgi:hypothetical protein